MLIKKQSKTQYSEGYEIISSSTVTATGSIKKVTIQLEQEGAKERRCVMLGIVCLLKQKRYFKKHIARCT